ncbi:MAG: hypothetical protein LBF68_01560 [Christensenellaceae bacterium]|jgi:hypothetical protein|nr:hypothetical protein [Christensenellaceae bacterium]
MKSNDKRKKINIFLLATLLLLIISITLFACEKDISTHKGSIEVPITNLSDLRSISDKLGEDYDEALFVLKNDITVSLEDAWQPLGSDIDNSFRGTFDGRGKKITIEAETGVTSGLKYFGLFGYIYGATIKNLKLEVKYDIETAEKMTYVGGLAGYAFGEVILESIDVSGEIRPLAAIETHEIPGGTELLIDKEIFAGGILGYGIGGFLIEDIDLNIDILIDEEWKIDYTQNNGFNKIFAGALAGYLRTPDISTTNSIRNRIKDINSQSKIDVTGLNVYAGGIIGMIYNSDMLNFKVEYSGTDSKMLTVNGSNHTYAGGAFGLIDNCIVNNVDVEITIQVKPTGETNTAKSFGGIAGYVNNDSTLSIISYNGDIYSNVSSTAQAFAGGIAGTLSNSSISQADVGNRGNYGFVINDIKTDATGYYQLFINGAYTSYMLVDFAGAIGRIYGKSRIENVTVDFLAYQGVVSNVSSSIEVTTENDEPVSVDTKDAPIIGTDVYYYSDKVVGKIYSEKNPGSTDTKKLWNEIGTEKERDPIEESLEI